MARFPFKHTGQNGPFVGAGVGGGTVCASTTKDGQLVDTNNNDGSANKYNGTIGNGRVMMIRILD